MTEKNKAALEALNWINKMFIGTQRRHPIAETIRAALLNAPSEGEVVTLEEAYKSLNAPSDEYKTVIMAALVIISAKYPNGVKIVGDE